MGKLGIILAALVAIPQLAAAATIDATLLPDGVYTVKVIKIDDPKHLDVLLDNGTQTLLAAARDSLDFTKVRIGDQVKLDIVQGKVLVFSDLTHG